MLKWCQTQLLLNETRPWKLPKSEKHPFVFKREKGTGNSTSWNFDYLTAVRCHLSIKMCLIYFLNLELRKIYRIFYLEESKKIILQEISIFFQILHHISSFTHIFAKRGHLLIDTSSIYFLVKKLKEKDKILVPFGFLSMVMRGNFWIAKHLQICPYCV